MMIGLGILVLTIIVVGVILAARKDTKNNEK